MPICALKGSSKVFDARTNTEHKAGGRPAARRRGFSLIELLVAIIIIGILVAVLLPVVSNRSRQARIARTNSDLENLSEAYERAAIDTGYYSRIFMLNDVLRGDDLPIEDPDDRYDGVTDYDSTVTNSFLQFPTNNSLFIDPNTGDFVTGLNRDAVFDRFLRNETTFDGTSAWNGPYITWQKDTNNFLGIGFDNLEKDGIPDDPWGNNYLFFTRAGLFEEPDGQVVTTVNINGTTWDCLLFDRPTVLSLGPNGLPGTGEPASEFGEGDDYFRQFGR